MAVKDPQDLLEYQDNLDLQEQKEEMAFQVLQDLKECKVKRVMLDCKDYLEFPEKMELMG